MVVDDFGDVYGIFLAITGDGFSQAELRRYADFLRRELLLVPNVKKVELFSQQQEVVYLEISRQRLAQLGINEEQIYSQLQAKNIAADGGRVRVGDQHIATRSERRIPLGRRNARLGDRFRPDGPPTLPQRRRNAGARRSRPATPFAPLRRQACHWPGYFDGAGRQRRDDGRGIRQKLEQLKRDQPVGIEIGEINFQPEAVSEATNDFIFNLAKAVTIVFVVLLLAMGRKTGLIIGHCALPDNFGDVSCHVHEGRSADGAHLVGALIIALCMLTDNAIIVIEGIKVGIEAGENKIETVREVVAQNQWPLFGATAIGVIAFAAIGLSEDSTGEYCNSLFWVIFISLSLSWISSITVTPLLSYLFFKPIAQGTSDNNDPYGGLLFRIYRNLLIIALRFRWVVVILPVVAIRGGAGWIYACRSELFPARNSAAIHGRCLSAGRHPLRETEAFANGVQQLHPGPARRHSCHIVYRRRRFAVLARL